MAETQDFKDKRKLFTRILRQYAAWESLIEAEGQIHGTLVIQGEEYHYMDIRDGFEILPPRQRMAVWLMCVMDKSEDETSKLMGFTKKPTPVQQYKNFGLKTLMSYQSATPGQKTAMEKRGAKYAARKRKKV